MSNVICQYIPHGAIPDRRGFAPAIVAENISKYFPTLKTIFISNQEDYKTNYEHTQIGDVYRIKEGKLYTLLFKKITRLDPYPLHIKAAQVINKIECNYFCAHQLEFPINEFKRKINKKLKILAYAHAARTFDIKRGKADKYLAVSHYTKNILIKKFNYPQELVEVVYNGVNTNSFNSLDKSLFKEFDINEIVISFIGRKQEEKGYYQALKVIEVLLKKYKNITILSVGPTPPSAKNSPNFNEMMKLKNKLLENKNFIDLPALTHDKLKIIYGITDILLFPSLHKGEQHPLVVLEAMASKNIVIASNIASVPEIITNAKNGFIISDYQNYENFLNQTIECIDNLREYEHIRKKARETIVSKFDWRISAKKLEEICLNL